MQKLVSQYFRRIEIAIDGCNSILCNYGRLFSFNFIFPFIMKESKQYWLIKSEPNTRLHNGKDIKFSIEDLEKCNTSIWDGVRNYEARNILRDRMKPGDLCLFYHSSCPIPGIVGLARIITEGYPDRK